MSNDSIKENADWLLEAIDHRFYFRGEVTCVHVCMCACVHVCMCACTPGDKIINVFRAWIGAQLTICAQK